MQLSEPQQQQLFDLVDESDYSLSDWQSALETFDSWLEKEGVTERPVDSMLGYVHCCTLAKAATLSSPDLSELLRSNLNEYGFDAAQRASVEEEK
jgi:hypothetical protein